MAVLAPSSQESAPALQVATALLKRPPYTPEATLGTCDPEKGAVWPLVPRSY